jgi:hypothetical protein
LSVKQFIKGITNCQTFIDDFGILRSNDYNGVNEITENEPMKIEFDFESNVIFKRLAKLLRHMSDNREIFLDENKNKKYDDK